MDRLAQTELANSKIVNLMREGVVVHKHDGKIESVNPSALNILGLTIDQIKDHTGDEAHFRTLHPNGIPIPAHQHPSVHGYVKLAISDSGRGISQEIQERMMTPFFTTKGESASKGLGLAVAKGILESHGGTLEYDPQSPRTCFVLKIPLAHSAAGGPFHKAAS